MSGKSPKSQMIRGAIWTIGGRWLIKSMGFVNTVVMARLLVPEDYGIVAMAMLTVGLIQTFLDFSATVALLRKNEVSRDEIDSAWTLRLIQSCLAGTVIAFCAPLAVSYFKEPRLLEVLWTFAACVVVAGAGNIGQTLALKQFNFQLDFTINTVAKLTSVIATIGFGLVLRDYRALTLGIVTAYLTPLLLSYCLHPYRPRWNTTKIPEIWRITKWLLVSNISGYLMRKSDELIAGRIGSTGQFGLYNVGSDLGQLPVVEVGPAMQRAILPVLASIKDDLERTRQAVLKTFSAVNTVVWPIGLGFAALSVEVTELVLGSKWLEASPYVAIFSVVAILQVITSPFRSFLTLLGHTKTQSTISLFEFIGFAILAALLIPSYHLLGLAYARLISSFVPVFFYSIESRQRCNLTYSAILTYSYRPILISVVMYFFVSAITPAFDVTSLKLLIGISSGIVFYTSILILTWHIQGRPEGLESTLFEKISNPRNTH